MKHSIRIEARRLPGFFFALAVVVGPLSSGAALADDGSALNDRALAAGCAACHGTDGRPVPGSALPGLAGMDRARLSETMHAFRDGRRGGTVMPQIAKGYDDARIARLARYFAAQR